MDIFQNNLKHKALQCLYTIIHTFQQTSKISYDVKCTCMYECQEVSNTARVHNFSQPQAFKEEIRSENQDQRKIFDHGGI